MKSIHALILVLASAISLPGLATAQAQEADFGGGKSPYTATVVLKSVDLETAANLDIALPANFKYVVQSVQTISRTAPSAVTTPARISLASVSGGTATAIRGSVAVESNAAGEVATLFAAQPASNGYFYTEDVAASTTSGLCTQNVALDTPGNIAGETSPLHPRKLVITTVDNAGDNLAGTVTLTGTNAQGEVITEVVTIVAGTDTHTTTSAFATLTDASHNFGATGQATVDSLDIGMSVQVALPSKNARVFRALTAGAADTVAAQDVAEGTYALTDVPDGITEQEVYYRVSDVPPVLTGGDSLRLAVTAGTVTGSDVQDIVVTLLKY